MKPLIRYFRERQPIYLATLLSIIGTALPARADFFYDFGSSVLPKSSDIVAGGVTRKLDTNAILELSPTFSATIGGGNLNLADTTPWGTINSATSVGGAIRAFWVDSSQLFGNVQVSSLVNSTGVDATTGMAVVARFNPSNLSGYAALIDYNDPDTDPGKADLAIVKVFNGKRSIHSRLIGVLDSNKRYFLEFDAVGNEFTARVFDSPGGTLVISHHYVDTSTDGRPVFLAGFSGVAAEANHFDIPMNSFYGTVASRAIAVPEPDAVLGLVIALGLGALLKKSRD